MIKGVLFDVGGVIIRDNSAFVKESMRAALDTGAATFTAIWEALVPLLGSGRIDEATFWRRARQQYGIRQVASDEDLFGEPFKQTLEPLAKVLAAAQELGERGIRRLILSNTIQRHADILHQAGLYDAFDVVLLSHEIGVRKPDPQAFDAALTAGDLRPSEVIFIDDRQENIKAAHTHGIQTILAKDEAQTVRDLLAFL